MGFCGRRRNFMDELQEIICEIESLKPEPEICNTRCPPLGCPRGPCPGLCCYEGVCDPCCISQMPCCPPPPNPPPCCAPPCLKAYAKSVGYPPESCLSPPRTLTGKILETCNSPPQNHSTSRCPSNRPPFCTTVPTCVSPCCPPNGRMVCRSM